MFVKMRLRLFTSGPVRFRPRWTFTNFLGLFQFFVEIMPDEVIIGYKNAIWSDMIFGHSF